MQLLACPALPWRVWGPPRCDGPSSAAKRKHLRLESYAAQYHLQIRLLWWRLLGTSSLCAAVMPQSPCGDPQGCWTAQMKRCMHSHTPSATLKQKLAYRPSDMFCGCKGSCEVHGLRAGRVQVSPHSLVTCLEGQHDTEELLVVDGGNTSALGAVVQGSGRRCCVAARRPGQATLTRIGGRGWSCCSTPHSSARTRQTPGRPSYRRRRSRTSAA